MEWGWSGYYDFLPWGHEYHYYKWDGVNYLFDGKGYHNPTYRYQAVQYGDRYSANGEYDQALEMYQQAIFNQSLEWWSPERKENERQSWSLSLQNSPTPTLPPTDPDEYIYLVSYARYRIMLLFVLQGWDKDAELVYKFF